jgi:glyoxylase-like metal-dependent hydrolase (beta-lactamase superfamily II)
MARVNATDEWYTVEPVTDRSWCIREGENYRMYLVEGSDRAALIDAGIGVGDLRGLVEDRVDVPVTLVLTHWHWDHIGAAAQFDDVRIDGREIGLDGRVAIDSFTDEFVGRPGKFVADWRGAENDFPDGFDPAEYSLEPVETPRPVRPGERLPLGERSLEYVPTPGHSRAHLAVLDQTDGVLYGGDVIHRDGGLYAHFEGCDLEAYRETFQRLIDLRSAGEFDVLVTGHGEPIGGDGLDVLERHRDGLGRILDGEAEAEIVETDWGPANRYEIDGAPVFTRADD